jgi:hypothetical protein
LGYLLGPLSMRWLGFGGSGVLWIALLVAALPMALGFSWLRLADTLGGWIDGVREHRHQLREQAEDIRLGERAQREREAEVEVAFEREVEQQAQAPLVIEPPVLEVPKSERVQRERQTPLFTELVNTKLPQVDLLDKPPSRVETVTPESLEMTSRLIEKKLGLRRRGACGGGPAGPGDHPLRDRAGHRREGLADRQPGQGPGALAVAGVHPRGRDHPRQEPDGAGAAQRQAPDHPPVRDPGLAGLQRRRLDADPGPGQGHHRRAGGGRPGQDAALLVAGTTGSGKSVGINA